MSDANDVAGGRTRTAFTLIDYYEAREGSKVRDALPAASKRNAAIPSDRFEGVDPQPEHCERG